MNNTYQNLINTIKQGGFPKERKLDYGISKFSRLSTQKSNDPFLRQIGKKGIPSFKKGGKVKKTGLALVHKGERVLTKAQVEKSVKKSKGYK